MSDLMLLLLPHLALTVRSLMDDRERGEPFSREEFAADTFCRRFIVFPPLSFSPRCSRMLQTDGALAAASLARLLF